MKTPLFFVALLCVGICELGTVQASFAQPTAPNYKQILVQSKQDLKDKDYAAVEEEAQEMLVSAITPEEKVTALVILGESFYRRKLYDQARAEWSKILTLKTDEDDGDDFQTFAHIALAKSYSAEGHFDKAIPEYKAGMDGFKDEEEDETDKKDADTHEGMSSLVGVFSLALANAYYNTKQLDLAREQLREVVKPSQDKSLGALTDLTRMLALTRSGQMSMEQRRFKKSLDEFNQVLVIVDKFNQASPTQKVASTLKEFVQQQTEGINKLIPLQLEEGEVNSTLAFRVKRLEEFDIKIDAAIQGIIDDFIFEGIIETLGSDD